MKSIGNTLRTARESQGRALADIAQELCVTQSYLSAIEKDDVSNLPGLFFYKSFARQYAAILHVDEALIAPELEALSVEETPALHPEIRLLDPLVEKTNRRFLLDVPLGWSVASLAAVLLLCSGFYSWWTRIPEQGIPQQISAQMSVRPVAAASPAMATQAITAAAAVETTPVANSGPEALSGIVLKLSATERTWLSVSSGGKEIFSGFLLPSESKILSGLDITTMRVGNAAGIDVHWNGKSIGPLGTRGQVLTIRFTPQDFEIVPPKEQL
jgi:cytoskeletal protein RodZ